MPGYPDYSENAGPGIVVGEGDGALDVVLNPAVRLNIHGAGVALTPNRNTGAVDVLIPGGGANDLADTLAVGNSADGLPIKDLADPTDPQDAATKQYVTDHGGSPYPVVPGGCVVTAVGAFTGGNAGDDISPTSIADVLGDWSIADDGNGTMVLLASNVDEGMYRVTIVATPVPPVTPAGVTMSIDFYGWQRGNHNDVYAADLSITAPSTTTGLMQVRPGDQFMPYADVDNLQSGEDWGVTLVITIERLAGGFVPPTGENGDVLVKQSQSETAAGRSTWLSQAGLVAPGAVAGIAVPFVFESGSAGGQVPLTSVGNDEPAGGWRITEPFGELLPVGSPTFHPAGWYNITASVQITLPPTPAGTTFRLQVRGSSGPPLLDSGPVAGVYDGFGGLSIGVNGVAQLNGYWRVFVVATGVAGGEDWEVKQCGIAVNRSMAGTTLIAAPGSRVGDVLAVKEPSTSMQWQPGIQMIRVVLTDAQIRALPTTPVEIIPAPGTGMMIVMLSAIVSMQWLADYTNATNLAGSILDVAGVSAAAQQLDSAWCNPFFGGAAMPTTYTQFPATNAQRRFGGGGGTDFTNAPVLMSMDNDGDGDFTGGDPANLLDILVQYLVVPAPV